MIRTIPIITSLTYRDKRLATRFKRAVRAAGGMPVAQRDLPYSSNTCFEWRLPHGHRQGGRVRGLRIVMGKKDAAADGGLLLQTLCDALANMQDADLQRMSKECLADFYVAAAASTGAAGKSIKIAPPTPFTPIRMTLLDLASRRRPEDLQVNPDLPTTSFSWFRIALSDDPSTPWIVGTVASECKTVDFDDIDAIDAMAATSNLARPHPSAAGE